LSPAKLQSLLQTAIGHHRAGRWAEAEQLYRQARIGAPKNFDVLHLSGLVAYQQGRVSDALDLLGRAHKMDPRNPVCEMRLAAALMAVKQTLYAEAHLRHAIELKPDFYEAWDTLGHCLKLQDRIDEAIACHRKSVEINPEYAAGWFNLGVTLAVFGQTAEALACHEKAIAAEPNYAMGYFGRAQALQHAHRCVEAVAEYDRFLAKQPAHHDARSYRLLALHNIEGVSREKMFAEHQAYGRAVGGPSSEVELPNSPQPQRRLRLAILSPDLRTHSCAYFIEPLLRHLDRTQFELFLYHDHFREDAVSTRLRGLASQWRNFTGVPNAQVEKTIRADAPDILIDLAGHTGMTSRLPLFAKRLAPVQANYLGYPDTTGVPAMDYRFTDAIADPLGDADRFATEKLVRFAPTAWTYAPPIDAPEVAPAPWRTRGHVTFGCFNNIAKITDTMLATWARVLAAVPTARMRFKGRGLSEPGVRAQTEARFARAGLPLDRLELLDHTGSTKEHLALYGGVDIALDTAPYNGTTTTCEALWMGVPVISLAGDRHMARVGASLLAAAGHPEWVASNLDDYVRIASSLAADTGQLAINRARLRHDLARGPLLDHAGQSAHFAAALRNCWIDWCEKKDASTASAPAVCAA
jgi:predicted O-linked N-acetylglucosamine transferase (SPINDLY family)